jgi:hypothetical protein
MTQDKIINLAEHNIPEDTNTLGVVWNNDTKEFFFTNSWSVDTSFLNNNCTILSAMNGRWEYDYADKNLQNDVDLFAKKKGFTLINKAKYHITYQDDSLYTKEYLLLLVKRMKGLL